MCSHIAATGKSTKNEPSGFVLMGLGRHVAVISAPADMILIVCEFVLSFPVILHLLHLKADAHAGGGVLRSRGGHLCLLFFRDADHGLWREILFSFSSFYCDRRISDARPHAPTNERIGTLQAIGADHNFHCCPPASLHIPGG